MKHFHSNRRQSSASGAPNRLAGPRWLALLPAPPAPGSAALVPAEIAPERT